jgi:hypothetical protein
MASFALTAILPAQDPPRAIAGKVLRADGAPSAARLLVRWRVHTQLPGLVGYTLGDRGIRERALDCDERGRFRVVPPHRGPFLLVAHEGDASSTQVFPVMAGDYLILRLEPTHFMAGVVLDENGDPVSAARVRLLPTPLMWSRLALYRQPERRGSIVTDAAGRFRLPFEHGYLRDPRWNAIMGLFATKGPAPGPTAGARSRQAGRRRAHRRSTRPRPNTRH